MLSGIRLIWLQISNKALTPHLGTKHSNYKFSSKVILPLDLSTAQSCHVFSLLENRSAVFYSAVSRNIRQIIHFSVHHEICASLFVIYCTLFFWWSCTLNYNIAITHSNRQQHIMKWWFLLWLTSSNWGDGTRWKVNGLRFARKSPHRNVYSCKARAGWLYQHLICLCTACTQLAESANTEAKNPSWSA